MKIQVRRIGNRGYPQGAQGRHRKDARPAQRREFVARASNESAMISRKARAFFSEEPEDRGGNPCPPAAQTFNPESLLLATLKQGTLP
ncbi:MAG TPA: hypothetical protein DDZ34_04725 [Syntrophaceae bacterium]|nr:hypothetical protein [Syntrophaceae bacterium]